MMPFWKVMGSTTMSEDSVPFVPKEQKTSPPPPLYIFFKDVRHAFSMDELGMEIMQIALPAALALAADPIASLVDTAFVGQIGPVELAAVGVSIAVFNQVSRIAIFPLVSVTTSFVAEEDALNKINAQEPASGDLEKAPAVNCEMQELLSSDDSDGPVHSPSYNTGRDMNVAKVGCKKKQIPSASSALVIGAVLGLLQAVLLIFGAKPILGFMGVKSVMAGDATNIILDPILMFVFRLGVSGAAIAHVASQYLISLILLRRLLREVHVLPPSIKHMQLRRFLKNGFLLLARVIAVTFCVTLAASMAARLGSIPMAAFQICLQIWLTSSLLADGLAVAGQAILASAFAQKDHHKATVAASRVLQLGVVLGLGLTVVLGCGLRFASRLFTNDIKVLKLIYIGIPFVALTQPINTLAFVFDGVSFGASDFIYSAYSMVMVAIASIPCLFILSSSYGFVGIWTALTIYMSLRTFAGFWRIGTARGPWAFLRS
ncbi:hypothetical protein Taro_047531 [Colocasia esculenta]|uniref:Protein DETOXIFICATION n=1 Tax=Colocasia esculenta TaxID=4460 RepID=A0A843X171_COLES|nr:hypothetical protein [Colocasia esculenta]